ncbi:hypothetical protein CVT26_008349 [Gymnopilus dilepis]|uniref:Uncharacterized protein n=1 Tax=Gymnopilus dilepis TaxID=231916 RepID=A0A409W9M6_9AGAR|nr:hypothetical protein CVT26_008349 [Gymnopilus dilepis]
MPSAFYPGWQTYAAPYPGTPYYVQHHSPWTPNTPLWAPGSPPRAQYTQFGPGWHNQGPPPSPRGV